MKVVINGCFGGFGLSKKAVKRLAELQGRECYFFGYDVHNHLALVPTTLEAHDYMWTAYDIPNPNELKSGKAWAEMTMEERRAENEIGERHIIESRPRSRNDSMLIQVIEELGKEASGEHAKLKIVEIPDGTEYVIEEYDGNEHIAEKHQTWS